VRRLLLFVFVLASCHKGPESGVKIDSSFTAFIPTDTKAIAGVQVDQLKNTEFYKRYQNQLNLPQVSALSERIGLDPRRDLSEILITWNGKQVLTMARGTFQTQDVRQKLTKLAPQQETYKNIPLFGDKKESAAILPHSLALAGPNDAVKQAIDGGGTVPAGIQLRLEGVLTGAQIWEASTGPLPLNGIPMGSGLQSGLANFSDYVNGTTLGIKFDAGVHLLADISCISAEGAQRVNDALRGLIGFARLSTKDNDQDMLHLLDAVKIDKTDQSVRIQADLTAELADRLLSLIGRTRK
jgi:hypothetical protein